jgi:hypothetical protein
MGSSTNEENKVRCPVEGCDKEVLARGLFMHIFQTDDPEGEGHYPRYQVPPDIDQEKIKITGKEEVEMDYPDEQSLDEAYYLDTYTGKAYKGKRGLMVHLGQKAGRDNIPSDVTKRHSAEDFPLVKIDDDGNVTEVIRWPTGDVPPIEPYIPWKDTDGEVGGYVSRAKIKDFVKKVRDSPTGAVSAEAIERELLKKEG